MFGYLKRSEFTKNIVILASGSTVAQVIPLLAEPVLSRLFTPSEFGVFEIFAAIIMMIGVVSTARYEMAIVLPRMNNKAFNLLMVSVFSVLLFSVVLLLIIWLAGLLSFTLCSDDALSGYLFYIPLGVLLFGLNRSFLFWLLRQKRMKVMSLSRIFESSGKAGSSILFGFMNYSAIGLIWGHLVGLFASILLMVWQFIKRDRKMIRFFAAKTMRSQAFKYREFPFVNVPIALSEMMQVSGVVFVFSFFFDYTSVGEFGKALRILLIPVSLIGTSFAQAFYQKASRDYESGLNITTTLKKMVSKMFAWSIVPLIVFLVISPWLFEFVLGPLWRTSGEYARILSVWIFIKLLMTPVGMIPLVIDRQKIYFLLNLAGNAIMIASIVVPGILNFGIEITLWMLSISQSLFLVYLYFKVLAIYRSADQNKSIRS